jgi:hypothetical protein
MTTIQQRTGIAGLVQRAWWEIRYFPIGKTVLYLYLGLPVACQWGQFDSPRQGRGVVKPLFSTSSDKEVRTVHDSYGGEANWQPVLFRHIEYTDGTTGKLVYHYHQPKFGEARRPRSQTRGVLYDAQDRTLIRTRIPTRQTDSLSASESFLIPYGWDRYREVRCDAITPVCDP